MPATAPETSFALTQQQLTSLIFFCQRVELCLHNIQAAPRLLQMQVQRPWEQMFAMGSSALTVLVQTLPGPLAQAPLQGSWVSLAHLRLWFGPTRFPVLAKLLRVSKRPGRWHHPAFQPSGGEAGCQCQPACPAYFAG